MAWGNSLRASKGAMRSPSSPSANSRAAARMAVCSGVSSKSTPTSSLHVRALGMWGPGRGSRLHDGPDVLADEADDVLRRGARGEDLLDAHRLERGDVLGRDDAPAEGGHVVGALLLQELQHALEEIVVGAGQHAEP